MTVPTVPRPCPSNLGTLSGGAVVSPVDRAQNRAYRHGGHTGHAAVHEPPKCMKKTGTVPTSVPRQ